MNDERPERPSTGDPLRDKAIDDFVESEYQRAIEVVRERVGQLERECEAECDHIFEYTEGEYGFEDYACTICGAWGSTSMGRSEK